jgi:hypothetical protein
MKFLSYGTRKRIEGEDNFAVTFEAGQVQLRQPHCAQLKDTNCEVNMIHLGSVAQIASAIWRFIKGAVTRNGEEMTKARKKGGWMEVEITEITTITRQETKRFSRHEYRD